jgi:hypothetical protein
MIRRAVAVGLMTGCVLATARALPMWHDDRALWTAAAGVADTPRAAVNLARLALIRNDVPSALAWDADALARATRHPETRPLVSDLVRSHLRWLLATSHAPSVCTGPLWASWCASL